MYKNWLIGKVDHGGYYYVNACYVCHGSVSLRYILYLSLPAILHDRSYFSLINNFYNITQLYNRKLIIL